MKELDWTDYVKFFFFNPDNRFSKKAKVVRMVVWIFLVIVLLTYLAG